MNKLENPELEKRRDYLRSNVLPRLQEMQRDLFDNEHLTFDLNVGACGLFVSAFSSYILKREVLDSIYLNFSVCDSNEQLESEYEKLTEFIKKYTA